MGDSSPAVDLQTDVSALYIMNSIALAQANKSNSYIEFVEMIYSSIGFRLPIYVAKRFIAVVPASHIALARLHISFSVWNPMYMPYSEWPHGCTAEDSDPKADEAEWGAFWQAFASLRVRSLFVEILETGIRVPEEPLLEPLRQVKIEDFEVVLPWPPGLETSGDFGDAGFVLRRPPEPVELMGRDVDKGNPGLPRPRKLWRLRVSDMNVGMMM